MTFFEPQNSPLGQQKLSDTTTARLNSNTQSINTKNNSTLFKFYGDGDTITDTFNFISQTTLDADAEEKVVNSGGSAKETSKVLVKASDCEIRCEKKYDSTGKLISDEIRIYQTKSKAVYMLPAVDGLDVSKITKVSSNKDGSFTVIADGKKYVFSDRKKSDGKLSFSFLAQVNANDIIKLNQDGSLKVTSEIKANVSDCEIRCEKKYDSTGKLISDEIRIYQTKSKAVYMLPAVDGLDVSKITKVSSNKDGSFTVIADGKKYVFSDRKKSDGKFSFSFLAQVNANDIIKLNQDGSLKVTSGIKANVLGCEISTEKNYDKNGRLISNEIKVCSTTSKAVYMLPAVDGLDESKITKVSSNKDGSFTVIADGKKYVFSDRKKSDGKLSFGRVVVYENEQHISTVEYRNGSVTTYTGYKGKQSWTSAIVEYADGSRAVNLRKFNKDGTYNRTEKKYNQDGSLIEIKEYKYDNQDRITNIEEYVGGKFNESTGKYEGGQYNIRTREYSGNNQNYYKCTRTTYSGDTKNTLQEYKEYEFLDEKQTMANISLTTYNKDGSKKNILKQTCYFGLKDENNCEYRYYLRSDGCIEMWHFDNAGVRTKVTVTHPDGKQVTHHYNASGESLPDTWTNVNLEDLINKYGKDKDGNPLVALY